MFNPMYRYRYMSVVFVRVSVYVCASATLAALMHAVLSIARRREHLFIFFFRKINYEIDSSACTRARECTHFLLHYYL